jgi:ribosomal protein L12E/L44/L45/RPP1/RPP2
VTVIKVTQVSDDGTETASIEVDDFTIEVLYAGLAEMLREAAEAPGAATPAGCELPREARQRRQRILTRIHT